MSNRSVRITLVLVAIAVALFVVVAVLKTWAPFKNIIKPPQSAYPPGTKINNPTAIPREFPAGIISTGLTLTHIDTVSYPNGREDITVVYNSAKTINELFVYYSKLLKSKSWTIQSSQFSVNSAVILAVNSVSNKLFVTITANKNVNTVTILYKK